REELDAELPARGDALRGLAQAEAGSQVVAAGDMGAEVEVAESEPRPAHAEGGELGAHSLRLADAAPAALLVVHAGEGVGDRVEVGADPQPGEPHVVAGVDHR